MYFPLFVGVLCLSLFRYALLCVYSSFAIILKRKRKLVALLLLSYRCIVTINALWLFLRVPWVGLQYVIVVFPTFCVCKQQGSGKSTHLCRLTVPNLFSCAGSYVQIRY